MITTTVYRYRGIGIAAVCIASAACATKGSPRVDSSSANGSIASGDSAMSGTTMVRGTLASVSGTTLAVQTDQGTTNVQLTQPLRVYERQPARLEDVTPSTFVGVTTVKQPDGTDRATEVHIFPDELRGLGEGSRPMAPSTPSGGTPSTMTNGSASGSQMSNGNVSSAGQRLVVQYAGGSITASVPANTPITKIAVTSKALAAGDRVVVVASKQSDGTLATNRVLLAR